MIKNKIAIGMNGSMLDEHPTGTGVYSFNLINHLGNIKPVNDWKTITVFTPTNQHLNKDLTIKKLSRFLLSSRYGKLAAFSRFIWNTFYYPFEARHLDLLISPTTHGSFILKNQIITIHDLISLRYENISVHQRFYFRYLLPFLISRARFIIAISEATKKDIIDLLKCPEEKIKVIYNGYDDKHYYQIADSPEVVSRHYGFKNYILAVGPTYPHKNFETLIHAFNDLYKGVDPSPVLLIAGGKKPYLDHLKKLVEELELTDKIHFLGYVPFDIMPSLYREAEMLVFPSLYEGFGFPLLEAMACGCPVISSNTSSMPEVCGNAALYFNPLDKEALRIAINRMLSEKEFKKDFITKGLEQASRFSWVKTAESFKSLIENYFQSSNLTSHVRH